MCNLPLHEPLWELKDVRPLVICNPCSLRSYFSHVMPRSQPVNDNNYVLCWCRDRHFRRTSIPAGRGAAASHATPALGSHFSEWPHALLRLHMLPSPLLNLAFQSSFSHHLGDREHDGPYVSSYHLRFVTHDTQTNTSKGHL